MKTYIVKRSVVSGLGLYANKNFKRGEFVIEYVGKKLTDKQYEKMNRDNRYMFELKENCTIDGSARSNQARYVNHSCKPNCSVDADKKIKFYAKKSIKTGEEFTIDYGHEYFQEYIRPAGCRCEHCKSGMGEI